MERRQPRQELFREVMWCRAWDVPNTGEEETVKDDSHMLSRDTGGNGQVTS